MKKIFNIILLIVFILGLTGCGKSNKEKMLKVLKEKEFECVESSEGTVCSKEEKNLKREFKLQDEDIDYVETVFDDDTVRLTIEMSDQNYRHHSHYQDVGVITAYFHGEDPIKFYPEGCIENKECILHINEKLYPCYKETYDKYLDYFNSEAYYELKSLWKKRNKSLSEKYRETSLEINYELIWEPIKDNDNFSKNVNDAARYFEKTLSDAGIILTK